MGGKGNISGKDTSEKGLVARKSDESWMRCGRGYSMSSASHVPSHRVDWTFSESSSIKIQHSHAGLSSIRFFSFRGSYSIVSFLPPDDSDGAISDSSE